MILQWKKKFTVAKNQFYNYEATDSINSVQSSMKFFVPVYNPVFKQT